jgi:hypothetical protein
MYELLIDEVVAQFGHPGESEQQVLERLSKADAELVKQYRGTNRVKSDHYCDPEMRGAYLLRYVGHYALMLGDLLQQLRNDPGVNNALTIPHLRAAALCGGPCPEVITLAVLHQQGGGRQLDVTVLDLLADEHWVDCWPITQRIASQASGHPSVRVRGLPIDLISGDLEDAERQVLEGSQILTLMNALNELTWHDATRFERRLQERLACLAPGTLVLAADQGSYDTVAAGMQLLARLLDERGARWLWPLKREPFNALNDITVPKRIRFMYGSEKSNNFRKYIRNQFYLAAQLLGG